MRINSILKKCEDVMLCMIMNIRIKIKAILKSAKIRIEILREMTNPMDTFWSAGELVNSLQMNFSNWK